MRTTKAVLGIPAIGTCIGSIVAGCGKEPAEKPSFSQTRPANHLSGRQLIMNRAHAQHGRNARVHIDSGFYGGAYQVTVWEDFHNYTYAVEVNEPAQR
jgi:hypothetical protein